MKNNIYKIGWQQYRIVIVKKTQEAQKKKDQKVKTTFVLYKQEKCDLLLYISNKPIKLFVTSYWKKFNKNNNTFYENIGDQNKRLQLSIKKETFFRVSSS